MTIQQKPQYEREIRINYRIRVAQVRLIDPEGKQLGIVNTSEALRQAVEAGFDLVEINPKTSPPVCKIMDFGKFKYEEKKKSQEIRRAQVVIDTKEIKLRPVIDSHDLETKINQIRGFLSDGDKVKITVRFRGREMAHTHLGLELLNNIISSLGDAAVVEAQPYLDGKTMLLMFAPPKLAASH
jgi:translation initiation factor IF-3